VAEPTPSSTAGGFTAQRNSSTSDAPKGLIVTWLQYSGPAKVTFSHNDPIDVVNGQAMTTATFTAPGTYKLVATAADSGRLSTKADVTVTVPATNRSTSR
jgi:hypothetical protein